MYYAGAGGFSVAQQVSFAQAMRDLNVDEQKIEAVIEAMNKASQDLGGDKFRSGAHIRPPSFGGSESANELGSHHSKAHQIVSDTIQGVTEDLTNFRDSTKQALVYVKNADQQAADDLNSKRAIAESMRDVWQNSAGDQRNQESRNQNLNSGDGALPSEPQTESGGN